MAETPQKSAPPAEGERLKIYFLPNLLTAGNLFCGFVALTKIVEAKLTPDPVTGLMNWHPIIIRWVAMAFSLGAWAGSIVGAVKLLS